MKRKILLATCCLLSSALSAQVELGVKGGLNLTNISADLTAGDYQIQSSPGSEIGFHFGGLLRVALFGIFVQPELLFNSVASEFEVTDQNTMVQDLARQRVGRIDVPVLIGARLGKLRLGLGPVASVIVSDKSELTDITGYETKMKSATLGYQVGIGFDPKHFGIDLRYEGNLTKLGDNILVGSQPVKFDSRARQVVFSLSYRF